MAISLFACIRTPHALDAAIAIARAFSPRVERHGPGCVVCDVSGLGRLLGEPPVIGAELWRACGAADAGGSVAIAPTQIAARFWRMPPRGSTVTSDPATSLAAVPVRVLHAMVVSQRPGAPLSRGVLERYARIEQAFEVFDRWGLSTLGDLASLPADALSARLGRIGMELRAQACGVDLDPLVPDGGNPAIPRADRAGMAD